MQIRGLDEFAVFTEMEFDYSRVQYRSHVCPRPDMIHNWSIILHGYINCDE